LKTIKEINSKDFLQKCDLTIQLMKAWYPFYLQSIKNEYYSLPWYRKMFKKHPIPELKVSNVIQKFEQIKKQAENENETMQIDVSILELLDSWDNYCLDNLTKINSRGF